MSTPRRSAAIWGPVADAAVQHSDADRAGEGPEVLVDLFGQFAGRGQDQRTGALRPGLLYVDNERDAEGEGLAGAGGGPSAHVPAARVVDDGGGLDGEGLGDAVAGERVADGARNAQLAKWWSLFSSAACRPCCGFVSPRRVC